MVVCPFIVEKLAGVFGDGGVDRDLRVGTSVRGATPVAIAEPTGSEKVRICRLLECVRRRDVGRLGMYGQRAQPKPRTVSSGKAHWVDYQAALNPALVSGSHFCGVSVNDLR